MGRFCFIVRTNLYTIAVIFVFPIYINENPAIYSEIEWEGFFFVSFALVSTPSAVLFVFLFISMKFWLHIPLPTFFQPQCSLPLEDIMTQEAKTLTTKLQRFKAND